MTDIPNEVDFDGEHCQEYRKMIHAGVIVLCLEWICPDHTQVCALRCIMYSLAEINQLMAKPVVEGKELEMADIHALNIYSTASLTLLDMMLNGSPMWGEEELHDQIQHHLDHPVSVKPAGHEINENIEDTMTSGDTPEPTLQ